MARYGGKPCDLDSMNEMTTCEKIKHIKDCDDLNQNHAYWAEWLGWGECAGTCHQPIGFRTRMRYCIEGGKSSLF